MAGTKSLGTGNTKCFTIFLGMSLHREPKGNEKHPSRQPLGTFWRRRKQNVHAKIILDIWAEMLHLCNGSGNECLSEQACPTCTLNASQNSWEDTSTHLQMTASYRNAKGGTLLHVSVSGCVQECACGCAALSVPVSPSQEENPTLLTLVGMRADRRKARHDVSTCNTKADVGVSAENWACQDSVSPNDIDTLKPSVTTVAGRVSDQGQFLGAVESVPV